MATTAGFTTSKEEDLESVKTKFRTQKSREFLFYVFFVIVRPQPTYISISDHINTNSSTASSEVVDKDCLFSDSCIDVPLLFPSAAAVLLGEHVDAAPYREVLRLRRAVPRCRWVTRRSLPMPLPTSNPSLALCPSPSPRPAHTGRSLPQSFCSPPHRKNPLSACAMLVQCCLARAARGSRS